MAPGGADRPAFVPAGVRAGNLRGGLGAPPVSEFLRGGRGRGGGSLVEGAAKAGGNFSVGWWWERSEGCGICGGEKGGRVFENRNVVECLYCKLGELLVNSGLFKLSKMGK